MLPIFTTDFFAKLQNIMKQKSKLENVNQYLKFSAMGIQMGAVIAIFALVGRWLDKKFLTETPYYTAGLALVGVLASMYLMIKQLPKSDKKNEK